MTARTGAASGRAVLCVGLLGAMLALTHADVVVPVQPGSVPQAREINVPDSATALADIFGQLAHGQATEGALLWLLQRNMATSLDYFQKESAVFEVSSVRVIEVGGIRWRLVEANYLSARAEHHGGMEWRARWNVAYLFDDLGQLRDWVADYDVLHAEDLNGDGRLDVLAYIDSPKRVIVYSYERGRSRELLRVDAVPEPGKPVEVVAHASGKAIRVAEHGLYVWDARSERYVQLGDNR